MKVSNLVKYKKEKDENYKRYIVALGETNRAFEEFVKAHQRYTKEANDFLNSQLVESLDFLELVIIFEHYVWGKPLIQLSDEYNYNYDYIKKKHISIKKKYEIK